MYYKGITWPCQKNLKTLMRQASVSPLHAHTNLPPALVISLVFCNKITCRTFTTFTSCHVSSGLQLLVFRRVGFLATLRFLQGMLSDSVHRGRSKRLVGRSLWELEQGFSCPILTYGGIIPLVCGSIRCPRYACFRCVLLPVYRHPYANPNISFLIPLAGHLTLGVLPR